MALTSLIFRNTYANEFRASGTKDVIFSFDTILTEKHDSSAQVTDREIESIVGQQNDTLNDHVVLSPLRVTLVGMVSETPIGISSAIVGGALGLLVGNNTNFGVNLLGGVLGGALMSQINSTTGKNEASLRTTNAYNTLLSIQRNRVVFDIVTGLKNYENMMIESISVDKNRELGKDAQYTAVLKQVVIVNSQEVFVDPTLLKSDVVATGSKTKDLGQQSASEASAKTAETGANKTALARIDDGLDLKLSNSLK